jgi:hypothetical protein
MDPMQSDAYHVYKSIKKLKDDCLNPRNRCMEIVSRAMNLWKNEVDALAYAEQQNMLAANIQKSDDERLKAAELLMPTNPILAEAILADAGCAQIPAKVEVSVDGIQHKKKWVARCVNKRELIHAVEKNPELTEALEVNLRWLSNKATDAEGKIEVPGILFELDEVVKVTP